MKSSKRFLSILLMLAMLVSMFTVMALAVDCNPPAGEGENYTHPNNNWTDVHPYHAASCTEDGNYWYAKCGDCGRWCWREGTDDTNTVAWHTTTEEPTEAAKIAKTAHQLKKHDGTPATETDFGMKECYECEVCGKVFLDEAGTNEVASSEDLIILPTGGCKHTVLDKDKHVNEADYYPYVYCSTCQKYFPATADGEIIPGSTGTTNRDDFKREPTNAEKAYDLTVDYDHGSVKINGKIQDNDKLSNIKKGDKVTVRAYDSTKYTFSYWKVVSGDLTLTYAQKYSREMTFTMPAGDVKLEAVYTKDSSSSHSHTYKYVKYNDTYHWKECKDCSYEVKEEHTWIKNTGSDKTKYPYICKYCDQKSTDNKNHNFKYTEIDSTYHWADCKDCSYSVKEKHTWIRNTSKSTKDEYAYVCEYCGRLSNRLNDLPFHDVSDSYWYYDDVLYAYLNGLMDGVSITNFGADQYTTRGQVVTILWRLTGEPRATRENRFTDVSSKSYYNNAISWAAEAGIVDGFDAKTFKPEANVTREQLAAILYRYAEYMNLSTKGASNLTKFDDYYQIGTWAREAMAWANYHGLIEGVGYSRIDPKGLATRAQVAAILHRFAVEFA